MDTIEVRLTNISQIDGLIYNKIWNGDNISFGFTTKKSDYGMDYSESPRGNFAEVSDQFKGTVRKILKEISRVINLDFVEDTDDPGAAVIRFGQCEIARPHAYRPWDDGCAGDIWFPMAQKYLAPEIASYAYFAILHEICHALGLKHPHAPHPYGRMPAEWDCLESTVMSYSSYPGAGAFYCGDGAFPQSLMPYDFLALQTLYGARTDPTGSDDVYSWDPATGERFLNGLGRGQPQGGRVFETVVDGGGWDTYDFSAHTEDLSINLLPGAASKLALSLTPRLGSGSLARGNVSNALLPQGDARFLIEAAIGGSGNDQICGNHGANYLRGGEGNDSINGCDDDDMLEGGAGDDVLGGGRGDDCLVGGTGRNLFYIAPGDGHDVIVDFKVGAGNVIDLRRFNLASREEIILTYTPANGGSTTLTIPFTSEAEGVKLTLMGMSLEDIARDSSIFLL